MPDLLNRLQKDIEYKFKNKTLLQTAMTHSSASVLNEEVLNYERLEFLGDRVLGLAMAEVLYKRYPKENEGDLAKRHAALVQGKTLAKIAVRINLGAAMILSDNERAAGGGENEHMLADGLEALLGAIYLDSGLEACNTLIAKLWDDLLDIMVEPPQDPKTGLQEWAQAKGLPLPVYEVSDREGPDHAPQFTVRVILQGYEAAEARGSSRRAAEKKAAARLLTYLVNSA